MPLDYPATGSGGWGYILKKKKIEFFLGSIIIIIFLGSCKLNYDILLSWYW
jgi:hypothetical protein